MVELKVRKLGVPPKAVVNRLRTKDGAPLFPIEGPDSTPQNPTFSRLDRHRNTLHVLAQ